MNTTKALLHSIKLVIVALLILSGVLLDYTANAAHITDRSLIISDSRVSANATYRIAFYRPDNGVIGSFELEICSNDPFPGLPCTAPNGFSFAGSNIIDQTGITDFSIHVNSTQNKLIFSRIPGAVASGNTSVTVDSATNPSQTGSYFVRLRTFASDDGTGASIDDGGLAFSISLPVGVTSQVPPRLRFCVGVTIPGLDCSNAIGSYVDFGELSKTQANAKTSQFIVATNADFGYVVYINGTQPTSGNNVIASLPVQTPSNPGAGQYGINLRANNNPLIGQDPVGLSAPAITVNYNAPNLYRFVTGDAIVQSGTTSHYVKYTVSYLINVSNNQAPGYYSSTLIYVATATF